MSGKIAGIIVAAGEGKRLGSPIPKAFVPLAGIPMFLYSVAEFCAHPSIDSVVVVVSGSFMDEAVRLISTVNCSKPVTVERGGDHRWQSVHNGILSVHSEWVLIHDAARPFVDAGIVDSLLDKRESYTCVVTGTPAVDTMRTFDGDRCTATIDRTKLVRIGTPQLFSRQALLDAFARIPTSEEPPTDEAVLMEQCGIDVGLAWGNSMNFKITTRQDLEIAEAIIRFRNTTRSSPVQPV